MSWNKTFTEPVIESSNPDSPMSIEEPDFSGLMALTEASIRQKLSELKYPDSDFSSSRTEDDSDVNIVSDKANKQPCSSSQLNPQTYAVIRQKDYSENQSESSGPNDPQSSSVDESKCPRSDACRQKSEYNIEKEGASDNDKTLMSTLEDHEFVKIVSLGLNTSNSDDDLKQSVKYCGLSVELPIENKNLEAKVSPEKVNNSAEVTFENISQKPQEVIEKEDSELLTENKAEEEASSVLKDMPDSEVDKDMDTERKTLQEGLSPESIKYCGISVEISHQNNTPPPQQGSVERNIALDSENKTMNTAKDKIETEFVKQAKDTDMDECPGKQREPTPETEVSQVFSLKESEKDSSDVNMKQSELINLCQSDGVEGTSVSDTENKIAHVVTSDETLTLDPENIHPLDDDVVKCQHKIISSDTDQTSMEVCPEVESDVAKDLTGDQYETVTNDTDDSITESGLGLVISDVCSATEVMEGENKQKLQVDSGSEETQQVADSQGSVKEINIEQHETDKIPLEISDDLVVIDVASEYLESDIAASKDNSKTELVCKKMKENAENNYEVIVCDDFVQVSKVSSESKATETPTNHRDEKKLKFASEVPTFSKATSKETESVSDTTTELKKSVQETVRSDQPFNEVTITEVVSFVTEEKNDSVLQKSFIPTKSFPANAELTALESMVMKVTPKEPETNLNRINNTSKKDKDTKNSCDNIHSDPCDSAICEIKNSGVINELQVINSVPTNNEIKLDEKKKVEKIVSLSEKNSLDQTEMQANSAKSKAIDSECNTNEGGDKTKGAKPYSPDPCPEGRKNEDVTETESSSFTEEGDMLLITNVRTISLDEEEKLTQESNDDKRSGNLTNISSEPDGFREQQNYSSADHISDQQVERTNGNISETLLPKSLSVTFCSLESLPMSQSIISKNTTVHTDTVPPGKVSADSHSIEKLKGKALDSHISALTPLLPNRSKSCSKSVSATVKSRSVENSCPVSSESTTLNSGMPVIANTFTVKEEPVDYEPYGMLDTTANSAARQPMKTQSSMHSASEIIGMRGSVIGRQVNIQPRRSSVDQYLYPAQLSQKNGTLTAKEIRHIPFFSDQQVVNAKVIREKVTQPIPSAQAANNNTKNTVNGILQHQKPPGIVGMSPAVGKSRTEQSVSKSDSYSSGQSLLHRGNVTTTSGSGVVAKVQIMKRNANGMPTSTRNPPQVPQAPTKPVLPVSLPPKFAMNLKTINIETVGIPMITEMIARKNPVPVYKPPLPPKAILGNEKTKQTFPCYECGDTFYFTSSLEQHTYRCSMKISYKCEWCRKILNFTNKCQLLSHLRSHMNIDKNQAVPIHIKSDSIEIQTYFDDIVPGKEFRWYKIPDKDKVSDTAESQYVVDMSSNNGQTQVIRLCKSYECTECKLTFHKREDNAKAIHFAPDKNVKPIFCGRCPMYLHNHCGMKAHRRLHDNLLKLDYLVCPECGVSFENRLENIPLFLQHLKTKCFHLSRFSTIKCSKCSGKFGSIEELRHHLTVFVEQYYKCNKCPMALKTVKSFKSHFKQTHQEKNTDDRTEEAKAKIIYRCHVCDTLIDDKEFLLSHIEKHLSDLKDQAEDYYHCLQCSLIFFDKPPLKKHYQNCHKTVQKESFCALCRTMKNDLMEYTKHILENHVASLFRLKAQICDVCGFVCRDEPQLRIHDCHMKNIAFVVQGDSSASQKEQKNSSPKKEDKAEHKKSPKKQIKTEKVSNKLRHIMPKPTVPDDIIPVQFRKGCPSCAETYWSNFKRIEHLRGHADKNIFICLYCENMGFKDKAELADHESACAIEAFSDKEDPIPNHLSKKCPSCNYVYGGNSKRNYHIKSHRGNQIYICMYCDAMSFNDFPELRSHEVVCGALSKTTVKSMDKSPTKTKIKLKFSKGKKSNKSSPEKSVQYQLEYKCDECGELFSRREKQEEHTRLEHGIHPCHLCGLMYESQTSLKKHLLLSHEGKKCVYYCWVCRRRRKFFSDVAHLQKHFTMKHKQKIWDPAKAVPALPGFCTSQDNKTPEPAKRRLETTPERPDTPVKKLRIMSDKCFKCAKCNFMSEERKAFQDHIKEHKTGDSVQCTECGLCFMVIPSLRKHLFMVHKVRDFDTYLKEHNIEDLKEPQESDSDSETNDIVKKETMIVDEPESAPDQVEDSGEEEGNPLECKVCYKKFETEHLMKSHMRVHGMAFIKKTRRSLSSSTKKIKLEEVDKGEKVKGTDSVKSVEKKSEAGNEEMSSHE